MKVLTSVFTVTAFSLLIAAHGDDNLEARRYYARQASTSSSSSSSSSRSGSSSPVPSNTANASVTASTSSTISVSLLSTNPTAVPLASIVSTESNPPKPLTTTAAPGPGPSGISGAPPLPDISNFKSGDYPKWDVIPPTDSPEVQQWIQDVLNTGIKIPNLNVTKSPLGCAANSQINANDPEVCWWYCGGCISPIDVTVCPQTLSWGLTYDDGPAYYTPQLLEYLDQTQLKSTFFVVGSRCAQFPQTLQAEYMSGHQIAVHTWSHHYLTNMTNEEIIAELGWSKKIIKDILGVTPNHFRPPFGDIDNRVRAIGVAMGLTPVIWTRNSQTRSSFDTGDFDVKGGTVTAPQVLQNWKYIMGNVSSINTGFIVLEHDLYEQAVQLATGYILPDALAAVPKFNITPVVSCLNMPLANAYIETNDNKTNPPLISGTLVTTTHVASSTEKSKSGSDASFSVGFSLMFTMTIVSLLAGVYAVRF